MDVLFFQFFPYVPNLPADSQVHFLGGTSFPISSQCQDSRAGWIASTGPVWRWPSIHRNLSDFWRFLDVGSGEPEAVPLPSCKLTARPWKWMVGILLSYWGGLFSGATLVSGRVYPAKLHGWSWLTGKITELLNILSFPVSHVSLLELYIFLPPIAHSCP